MKNYKAWLFIVTLVIFMGSFTATVCAYGFSAKVYTYHVAGQTVLGRVYVGDRKVRIGDNTIINLDKYPDDAFILHKESKSYERLERMAINGSVLAWLSQLEKYQPLGDEKLNGEDMDRYRVVENAGGNRAFYRAWCIKDTPYPKRLSYENTYYVLELTDIKIGEQPPELFEIPGDYQEIRYPILNQ
jgi:hypothetical protein